MNKVKITYHQEKVLKPCQGVWAKVLNKVKYHQETTLKPCQGIWAEVLKKVKSKRKPRCLSSNKKIEENKPALKFNST